MAMTCIIGISSQLTGTVFFTLQLLIIRAHPVFDAVRPTDYAATISQGHWPMQSVHAHQRQRHGQHRVVNVDPEAWAGAVTDGMHAQAGNRVLGQHPHVMRYEQRKGTSGRNVAPDHSSGHLNRPLPELVPSSALLHESNAPDVTPMTYSGTSPNSTSSGSGGSGSSTDSGMTILGDSAPSPAGFHPPSGANAETHHLSNLAQAEQETEKFDKIVTGAEALASMPDSTKTTPVPEDEEEEKEGPGAMMIIGIVLIVICGIWSIAWLVFVISIYSKQPAKSGEAGEDAGEEDAGEEAM